MHPARGVPVPPERVKLFAPAHGAQVRRVDSLTRYAGFFQLARILRGEVQAARSLPPELLHSLRPHLVAAHSDTRSDGRVQIRGNTPEARTHRLHRPHRDP